MPMASQSNHPIPSPMNQKMLMVSFGFITLLVLVLMILAGWAWFFTIDESVAGVGEMVPEGSYRKVRAPMNGIVAKLYVQENSVVKAGQLLAELDPEPSEIQEDRFTDRSALLRQEAQALKSAYMSPGHVALAGNSVSGAWLSAAQEAFQSRMNTARMQIDRSQHQYKESAEKLAKTQSLLTSSEALLKKHQALYEDGGLSEVELKEYEQKVLTLRGEEASLKEQVASGRIAMAQAQEAVQEVQGTYREQVLSKLTDLEKQIVDTAHDIETSQLTKKRQYLLAPVDGVVHQQSVHGPGDVIKAGEDMIAIVPSHSPLLAEVKVSNRDLSYIHPEQAASMRLDAFPFQKFGRLDGIVKNISPSSLKTEQGESYYLVYIQPKQPYFEKNGTRYPLKAGMSVSSDIITRKKNLLSFFTEPIELHLDRAFRDPSNKY